MPLGRATDHAVGVVQEVIAGPPGLVVVPGRLRHHLQVQHGRLDAAPEQRQREAVHLQHPTPGLHPTSRKLQPPLCPWYVRVRVIHGQRQSWCMLLRLLGNTMAMEPTL